MITKLIKWSGIILFAAVLIVLYWSMTLEVEADQEDERIAGQYAELAKKRSLREQMEVVRLKAHIDAATRDLDIARAILRVREEIDLLRKEINNLREQIQTNNPPFYEMGTQ